jgi:hypothetical protein
VQGKPPIQLQAIGAMRRAAQSDHRLARNLLAMRSGWAMESLAVIATRRSLLGLR